MGGLKAAGWNVFGHNQRSIMLFESDYEKAYFIHGMFENGILMNRPNLSTLSHTREDVERTILVGKRLRDVWDYEFADNEKKQKRVYNDKLPRTLFSDR